MKEKSKNWLILIYCLKGIFIICLMGLFLLNIRKSSNPVTNKWLDSLAVDKIDKIMVVAHPDDETFWGGGHLAEETYLVVCLTNGKNEVRKKEFEQAVSFYGSVPLILNYPDKELGIRSRWTGYSDDIKKDLETIFSYKDWKSVVTHNKEGEYGHIHHKKTSNFVTESLKNFMNIELYYFGKYYTKEQIEQKKKEGSDLKKIKEESREKKQVLIDIYQSQNKAADMFEHMFSYEEWQLQSR